MAMFGFRGRLFRVARAQGGRGGAAPSSSSLSVLSLALRLVVTRGWPATLAAGHGGAVSPSWTPAAPCGYTAAISARQLDASTVRRRNTTLRGARFYKPFGAGHYRNDFCRWFDLGASRRAVATNTGNAAAPTACDDADVGSAKKAGRTSRGESYGSRGTQLLRLSKLLADRAVGTRTEVDALVRRGRIKVDGAVVRSPKTKLPVDCVIEVNGEECGQVPLLVAFHKPKGVICSLNDDWDREDLSNALPKSLLLKHHPVGRLDGDSSGLLLLSSDGTLTHRLLNPRFNVEREYVATVEVPPLEEEPGDALVEALNKGVPTADGVHEGDVRGIDGRDVTIIVREGKNRMVRRMLANAGYPVLELRRERYGKILLGDLAEGEHKPVSGEALEWAWSIVEGAVPGGRDGRREDKRGASPDR